MSSNPNILLCCGEMSGDMHAAQLIKRLREQIPGVRIRALGGDRCAEAGAELLFHYREYAILGFSGVLANIPKLWSLERALKKQLRGGVDLFIAVDYPGLNMRLAAYAKKMGVPVLYYISPQLWAWGAGRMDKLARSVDMMAVILPFEKEMYERAGVPVEYVGHPFVVDHESPPPLPDDARSGIGILPGSRSQEVHRVFPVMLEAAKYLAAKSPGLVFTVGRSPAVPEALYQEISRGAAVDLDFDDDAVAVMRRSKLLLVASGTATLQGALLHTPLVIVYKVSAFNYFLARRLVTLDRIGLVNVVLGDMVCPEFIQRDAVPGRIGPAALELFEGGERRRDMLERFATLGGVLSGGGGCKRVAELAAGLIDQI